MTEELKQKAKEYLREHSKYSEVFNQTFICVDTLTAMVEFATEATKELQEEITRLEGEREDFLYNWYCDHKGGCKVEDLEKQLTEAKEIIKNLLSAYTSYADDFDDRDNEIVAEAEQFLKE